MNEQTREVVQQALDALEVVWREHKAIDGLRQLLEAEPVQEPVALKYRLVKIHDALDAHLGDTDPYTPEDMTDEEVCEYEPVFWAAKEIAALIGDAPWSNYTTPPAQQAVQMTVDEVNAIMAHEYTTATVQGRAGFIAGFRAAEVAYGITAAPKNGGAA